MNGLAISAVILFVFLIPGLVVPYRYYAHAKTWETSGTIEFGNEKLLSFAIIISLPIHCIWISAITILDPILHWGTVDFKIILEILQGNLTQSRTVIAYQLNNNFLLLKVCVYFLSQVATAWYAGRLASFLATKLNWDKTTALASKGGIWHKAFAYPKEDPDFITLSLAVTMGDKNYIYHGALSEYQLTNNGDLHRVILQLPQRSELVGNSETTAVELEGEFLSMNCDNVESIIIDYVWLNNIQPPLEA